MNGRTRSEHVPHRRLQGHLDGVSGLAWDAAGSLLVSSSFDGTARSWSADGALLHTVARPGQPMTGIALSADGERAVITLPDRALVWDPRRGRELGAFTGHSHNLWDAAISPDQTFAATASHDHTVRVWDIDTQRELMRLDGHTDTVLSIVIMSDGRHAISAGDDETIRVWSIRDGRRLATLAGHAAPVRAIALTKDETQIVSASMDRTLKVWDLVSGEAVATLEGHAAAVGALSVSGDGRLVASASFDGSVILWSTDTWAQVATLRSRCTKFPVGLAFSSGTNMLATIDRGHDIVLWEIDADALLGQRAADSQSYYTNAKVAIVGESGTGKSCLARALAGQPFAPQESTHGMNVWNLGTVAAPADSRSVTRETFLWDFAGQPDYHVVHQLFLARTSLAIVMFDPTRAHDPFAGVEHWRSALDRLAGEQAPAVLVAGRVDRGFPAVSDEEIGHYARRHGFERFIATSAKTMRGIAELRRIVEQHIRWETLPVTSSPRLWRTIRDHLLRLRDESDVLVRAGALRDAFRVTHRDTSFTDDEFDAVAGHAQAQGLVWKLSFGDLLLLRPELLNSYASAVVRAAREHPLGLGSVIERDVLDARIALDGVERLARIDDERLLLHAVVELLLAHELAFREGELLVFPSKHNRSPAHLSPSLRRQVRYQYSGPIESTYATLIVRLAYCGAFSLHALGRNAAEFRDALDRSCAVMLEVGAGGTAEIVVCFDDAVGIESKVLLLRFVDEHLQRKTRTVSLIRKPVYRCPSCGEDIANDKAVAARLAKGFTDIRCQFCSEPVPLSDVVEESFKDARWFDAVQALDTAADKARTRAVSASTVKAKNQVEDFDVFLAYNARDQRDVEAIAQHLKDRGLNPWLYRWSLPPGRRFAEEIERVLPTTRAVAVFVGESGAGPWEEMEIYAALQLFVRNKRPLIPVLLPGAEDNDSMFPLFLQQFNRVRFEGDAHDENALDDLQWGITGRQPKRRDQPPGVVAREDWATPGMS